MKTFILGLVLGLSLASLGVWAGPRDRDRMESWSEQQDRLRMQYPIDLDGEAYTNVGGLLVPSNPRRGPC